MSDLDSKSDSRRRQRRRKRLKRRVRFALIGVAVLVVAIAAYAVYQAKQARDSLNEAAVHFDRMTHALAAGHTSAAREDLFAAQSTTMSARRDLSGPVWWVAGKAPWIGDDVTAVRTVADVADDVARNVAPALIDVSKSLSAGGLQPHGGRIDLRGLEDVTPRLVSADAGLADAVARITALEPESLMSQIEGPVRQVEDKLTQAHSMSERAVLAARLIPPMLGADAKRTYLVLFQNNAEIRATGGIPGAIALITAEHGRLSLLRQGDASALGAYAKPALPLTAEERALFTIKLGIHPADITFTPSFPRAAQIAQEMWRRSTGQTVDGVLSTDPVALSYLLGGTGPIPVSGGQKLTAANAVQLLLNQIYLELPDAQAQNKFFAEAAKAVFDAVSTGQGDPRAVLDGIVRGASEHRILVWSDHPAEEALLAPTALAGALPTRATTAPQVGVYLNDGTGAKLDYYLDYGVGVEPQSCAVNGVQTLRVTVTMTSNAPADAGSLPVSVKGPGFGARPGYIRTNLLIYAPVGGQIHHPLIDGHRQLAEPFTHDGRQVAAQTIDLAPAESHKFTFTLVSGPDQTGNPDVQVTPAVPGSGTVQVGASTCG